LFLPTILVATFMSQFDFFVVNVAAPSIRSELHASAAGLQLIVAAYAFGYAGALVLGGRLGDLFGYRRLFTAGMTGFTAASVSCAASGSTAVLVASRLGQGLAAAMMLPQVLALISVNYGVNRRSRAMAWFGVAGGAGAIAGQLLGGFLVTAAAGGHGWRAIFWINLPVGAIGLAAAFAVIDAPRTETPRATSRVSLDVVGAIGIAVTMAAILVPLTFGPSLRWPWWIWLCLAGGALVGLLAARWERRPAGEWQPLFAPALLRIRSFALGLVSNSAFMAFFASYMFALALFLQNGLGLDPLGAGLVFAPAATAFSVSALVAPAAVRRWRGLAIASGAAIAAVGLCALAVLCAVQRVDLWIVVVVIALISLGNGIILPSLVDSALVDARPDQAGAAAGAISMAQQFASAAGVAGVGGVYLAAAGSTRHGAIEGMSWAAGVCVLLVLAVGVTAVVTGRPTRASRDRAASAGGPVRADHSDSVKV
jgi:MFS family permease